MDEIQQTTPTSQNPKSHRIVTLVLGLVMIGTVLVLAFITKSTLILLNPVVSILLLIGIVVVIFSLSTSVINKFFRGKFSVKKGLLAFLIISAFTILAIILVIYLVSLPERNQLKSYNKKEKASFTLLSPANNSILSGPVTFSLPGSRQLTVENIGTTLQTETVDHATIVVRGPENKEFRPYRNGDKLLFTANLPSGTYTAFARQEPWNDQPTYDAYQFDHPATPTISFTVNAPSFTLDTTPPQVQIIGPAAGTNPAPTMRSAMITAQASDNGQVMSAEIYTNNLLWCPSLPVINGKITCQLHLKYDEPLSHIRVKVYDSQGNEGVAETAL